MAHFRWGVRGPNLSEPIWTHLKQIESLRVVWTLACILVFQICISYRLFSNISHPSSSACAPRSDRATALQADEEANHGHYPPLSDVCAPILHRSSAMHLLFLHRDLAPDLQADEETKRKRDPTAFWCVRYQAIPMQ
jgi:hypothetical protein